jgi:hypothetical protein
LGPQYVPPEKERLQQDYEQGDITLGPAAGAPNERQRIIDDLTLHYAAGDSRGRTP